MCIVTFFSLLWPFCVNTGPTAELCIKPHQEARVPRANMPTAAILADLRVALTVLVSVPLFHFFSLCIIFSSA